MKDKKILTITSKNKSQKNRLANCMKVLRSKEIKEDKLIEQFRLIQSVAEKLGRQGIIHKNKQNRIIARAWELTKEVKNVSN